MESDEELSDADSYSSAEELQIAFQKGLLKPGLNVEIPPEKKIVNDKRGLTQALADLRNDLPWVERLDVTVAPLAPPKPMAEQLGDNPDDLSGEGVHDDFKREMKFHRQAQAAVLEALPRLISLGIGTRRPEDYFAEMSKSDRHMKKVREKLLAKQIGMERSEKAKKLRELRKYGKKVQHEVLQKRQKEKREMADALKKYRKGGKQDKLDFLEDRPQGGRQAGAQKEVFQPNRKRQSKNHKFGFGGQKKRSKSNTKASADDVSGFSAKTHNTVPGKKSQRPGNKNKKRPGKMRRKNSNSKRK